MEILFKKLVKLLQKSWQETEKTFDDRQSCSDCVLLSKSREQLLNTSSPFERCNYCQLSEQLRNKIRQEFERKVVPEILRTVQDRLDESSRRDEAEYAACKEHLAKITKNAKALKRKLEDSVEMNKVYMDALRKEAKRRRQLMGKMDALTQSLGLVESQSASQGRLK